MEDESVSQNQNKVQKLVTADGTYATQSAFDTGKTASTEAGGAKDDSDR